MNTPGSFHNSVPWHLTSSSWLYILDSSRPSLVCTPSLVLYLHYYQVLLAKINPKGDFCFYQKGDKAFVFCSELFQRQGTLWSSKSGATKRLLQELHSACQPQAVPALNWVVWASVLYLNLFYASRNERCPNISEKPKRGYCLRPGNAHFFHIN